MPSLSVLQYSAYRRIKENHKTCRLTVGSRNMTQYLVKLELRNNHNLESKKTINILFYQVTESVCWSLCQVKLPTVHVFALFLFILCKCRNSNQIRHPVGGSSATYSSGHEGAVYLFDNI